MKEVLILGAGGHSKVLIDILEENNRSIKGLLDDDLDLKGNKILGYEILGSLDLLKELSTNKYELICSIGTNTIRKKIYNKAKELGFSFTNAIHPSAIISQHVDIGTGVTINSGVTIHPDVKLKNNIIIGMNSTISHDVVIDNHVHISPKVSLTGNVKVNQLVDLGVGVDIIPGTEIKQNSIIGAGAVVTQDIPANVIAVGIPAKVIKKNKEE